MWLFSSVFKIDYTVVRYRTIGYTEENLVTVSAQSGTILNVESSLKHMTPDTWPTIAIVQASEVRERLVALSSKLGFGTMTLGTHPTFKAPFWLLSLVSMVSLLIFNQDQ